jgi:hypothetical protein
MEVIRLSGYIAEEKIEIAKKYLIPKTLKAAGSDEEAPPLPQVRPPGHHSAVMPERPASGTLRRPWPKSTARSPRRLS